MGRHAASDVVFDFDGALVVARRLWALADSLETVMAGRETLAVEALTTWRGSHATSFATRMGTERTDIDTAAGWLRVGAQEWAAAWKDAMDEQNRILHARECQRREDDARRGTRAASSAASSAGRTCRTSRPPSPSRRPPASPRPAAS